MTEEVQPHYEGVGVDVKANVYFDVPGNSSFEIAVDALTGYVCSFG